AGEILRALQLRGLGGKIAPQRIAGGAGEAEPLDDEVEVEIVDALAVLYGVDQAESGVDAERAQVLDERHVMGLERRLVEQELDADPLALWRHALAVLDRETCLLQQRARLAK